MMNLREARRITDAIESDTDAPSVFGTRYQTPDGATVIPVSKPVGVFVVKDGKPVWSPATNDTRIALFGILVGFVAATLTGVAMVVRPPWPDLHGDVSKRFSL